MRARAAEDLARALGGRRSGKGWLCRCPAHSDHHPSLSITERNGRVSVHCWSGCTRDEVTAALAARGLWRDRETIDRAKRYHHDEGQTGSPAPRDPLRSWRRASPRIVDTAVESYLASRGLSLPQDASSLRFERELWHWPSQTRWPAMLALVRRHDGEALTVHQTFLAADGRSKAAIVPQRLFPSGKSPEGGGVWFGQADLDREFLIAEGVESLLSAMALAAVEARSCPSYPSYSLNSDPFPLAGCAALSAGGIRALVLPSEAQRVRIVADNDRAGLAAARDAYRRWRAEGRAVRVSTPDESRADPNDVWLGRMKATSL